MLSIRTTKALALFTVMATTVSFSGCGDEEVPQAEERDDYENFAGDVLTDEAGREYKLHDNGDGTETARYANGDSVTFRRDEGGLSFLSGTAGLLAGLAAGYFIHRGLSGGHGGYYDANRKRYVASEPVRPLKKDKEDKNSSNYRSSSGSRSSSKNSSEAGKAAAKSSAAAAKNSATGNTKSSVSAKSGFGSAGARSASS
ncbi:hypothetical protein [Selenomonas ruminantium]|jgi:hypothetical protein|uniref:hypothetical protein n=1 Tax=Selenomonas ruminantium TaxID=971 RepID=UPI0015689E09|nr:hypothetical protein [Selenomonas ruminantium]